MMAQEQQRDLQVLDDLNFGARSDSNSGRSSQITEVRRSEKPKRRREEEHSEDAKDASVWGNFTAELMESVLARLPFPSLIKFRGVCKSWNVLISSRAFHEKIYQIRQTQKNQHESWLLFGTATENKVAFYVPSLKKWHITTLPLLEMDFHDVALKPSMGGLVCLTKYNKPFHRPEKIYITDIFVWNPLTNNCRKLPRTLRSLPNWEHIRIAGVYVNYTTMEYKVMIVETVPPLPRAGDTLVEPRNTLAEIYDSSTNAWKICDSGFPHQTELGWLCEPATRRSTSCNSSVYSITVKADPDVDNFHTEILAFEMKTEVWREIIQVQPTEFEGAACINCVELYNKLYLVARIYRDDSVRLWRLVEREDGRGEWIEEDRLPQEFVELLDTTGLHRVADKTHWQCTGSGDSLFFNIYECVDTGFVYNVSTRSWSLVPGCDLENRRNRKDAWFGGVAFCPGWMSP